jgi:cytosine/adenosine deaminase-related metal-dependent hydrolase
VPTVGVVVVCACALVACKFPDLVHRDGAIDDADPDGGRDGSMVDPTLMSCPGAVEPDPNLPACSVTAGNTSVLIRGEILRPRSRLRGGELLIDANGYIACVGCDCAGTAAAIGATVVDCQGGVVSPGLINGLDHVSFSGNLPVAAQTERYEHRHDWRRGIRDHTQLTVFSTPNTPTRTWNELRAIMAGTTSIVGSGGVAGLARNLDIAAMAGLGTIAPRYETFPLGDTNDQQLENSCAYPEPAPIDISTYDRYYAQISEGIDAETRNEFRCAQSTYGILAAKTTFLHASGLLSVDLDAVAAARARIVWTPRSDISLYGDTLRITAATRLGVRVGLGNDWVSTGSMNMLRELACVRHLSTTYLANAFDDWDVWMFATSINAEAVGRDPLIGTLRVGAFGDVAIFDGRERGGPAAIIDAAPEDVTLVFRAGVVQYGDDTLVEALRANCDPFDVCQVGKRACLVPEGATTLATLQTDNATVYPLSFCGAPPGEPTCTPERNGTIPPPTIDGSNRYTGIPSATDNDGDGIVNSADKCPDVFDPIRPVDNGMQADTDLDGIGDACDPCPLTASTSCAPAVDIDDRDGDGHDNWNDNCPDVANADQQDGDGDGRGYACDPCPAFPNLGLTPCP